jgi:predicted RNase H-like HicB family nuclease
MIVRRVLTPLASTSIADTVQRRVRGFISFDKVSGSMPARRDTGGKFAQKVEDGDLIHHFTSGTRDFYTAGEIADAFDLDDSQANRRLNKLAEDGELEKLKPGPNTVIWWRDRDTVVLDREDDCGDYAVIDTTTGVASQGETRAEALRMLADALELTADAEAEPTDESEPDAPWF